MDQSKDVKMEPSLHATYSITVTFFVQLFVLMFYKLWVSQDFGNDTSILKQKNYLIAWSYIYSNG